MKHADLISFEKFAEGFAEACQAMDVEPNELIKAAQEASGRAVDPQLQEQMKGWSSLISSDDVGSTEGDIYMPKGRGTTPVNPYVGEKDQGAWDLTRPEELHKRIGSVVSAPFKPLRGVGDWWSKLLSGGDEGKAAPAPTAPAAGGMEPWMAGGYDAPGYGGYPSMWGPGGMADMYQTGQISSLPPAMLSPWAGGGGWASRFMNSPMAWAYNPRTALPAPAKPAAPATAPTPVKKP